MDNKEKFGMATQDIVKIVSKGSDWITMTATDTPGGNALVVMYNGLREKLGQKDEPEKKWSGLGYRGTQFLGVKCGVRKEDETILILAGDVAENVVGLDLSDSIKVTRLDFQVTVELSEPDSFYAQRCYTTLEDLQILGGKKRYLKLIKSLTGTTLNVGSRKSSIMLRLYDKSGDLGSPYLGHLWRYEVEFKKDAAIHAYKMFHVKQFDEEYLASVVFNEFNIRGLPPKFTAGTRVNAIEVGSRISTIEGQLSWLRRCVAPVVVQLLNLGYEEQVLKSIRLKHIVKDIKEK